jgi:hypothetical protein
MVRCFPRHWFSRRNAVKAADGPIESSSQLPVTDPKLRRSSYDDGIMKTRLHSCSGFLAFCGAFHLPGPAMPYFQSAYPE